MKARRALLINPPLRVHKDFIDYPFFTSLGVAANAAVLRDRGWRVSVADAQAAPSSSVQPCGDSEALLGCSVDRLLEDANGEFDAVVVGLSPFLKPHVRTPFAAGLFSALRARFPAARLVAADCHFGGMHYIEYGGEDLLQAYPELDSVLKYECEAALPALLAEPAGSAPRVVCGDAEAVDPDALPFPAWDLIDVRQYYSFLERFPAAMGRRPLFSRAMPALPAVTSRGCVYRCAFCTSNPGQSRPAFRPHSPAYLEKYFRNLKTRHGARRLALLDGCANHAPDRFSELLGIVRSLGLRCEFPNGLRADRLDFATLKALQGLSESVSVSGESGDPEVLARIVRKGMDIAAVERVASWCRELKLPLNIHYLVGLPGETVESVNRTLAHALRMKEEYGATPLLQNFVPLPGAPLYEACAKDGLLEGFDAGEPYPHFQAEPAIGTAAFSREQLGRMTALFQRRLEAASLEKVIINITYHCNNNCRYCATGDRPRRHGDLERYCGLLREYRERGVSALDLDGGEPTLWPPLLPFIGLARKAGYQRITVTSNGRRLAQRPFAARFLLSGVTNLLVSLHGHTARVHDRETRSPGSFRETVVGIRHAVRLKPGRVSLAVNTLFTPENAPHAARIFAFLRGLGVQAVNVQFVTPFGRAGPLAEAAERVLPPVAEAVARWKDALKIQLVNALPCRTARYFPGLAPELGKHGREMVFADAAPQNLASYLDTRRRKTEACAGCEFSIGCAGFYAFGTS